MQTNQKHKLLLSETDDPRQALTSNSAQMPFGVWIKCITVRARRARLIYLAQWAALAELEWQDKLISDCNLINAFPSLS